METQSSQPFGSPASSPGLLVPNNSPAYGFPAGERAHPHMLNRVLEATIPNAPQQINPSGFVRPQQVTTRLRRSAVVPSLRSNRPRNNSQAQLDEMNNAFFPGQSYDFSQENGSNYQSVWHQQSSYGQQHDYDQQRVYTQQAGSYNQVTYGQQNNFGQESTIVSSPILLKESNSDPRTGGRTCTSSTAALCLSSGDFGPGCVVAPCSSRVNNRAARTESATYEPSQKLSG